MFVNKLANIPCISAALLFAATTLTAEGANLRWLDNSPARFFTESDWEMMTAKFDEVLNDGEDGREYAWNNPDTGSSGSFVAQPAEDRNGQRCRLLTISNRARAASETSQFTFCLQENGEWMIVR